MCVTMRSKTKLVCRDSTRFPHVKVADNITSGKHKSMDLCKCCIYSKSGAFFNYFVLTAQYYRSLNFTDAIIFTSSWAIGPSFSYYCCDDNKFL